MTRKLSRVHLFPFHDHPWDYVDFILNLAGLLLWLNWRALRFDPVGKRKPATLLGTLRRVEPQRLRHWHLLAAIGGLLLVRAGFYWQIGLVSKPVWAGTLDLGIIAPSFLSNSFGRMCLFSMFSFGLMLAVFYLWLLLLSHPGRPGAGSRAGADATGRAGSPAAVDEIVSCRSWRGAVVVARELVVGMAADNSRADLCGATHRAITAYRPRQLPGLEISSSARC